MKIVVAVDSYKGCMTSAEAAEAVRRGIAAHDGAAETVCLPVSDGGEGMLHAFSRVMGATTEKTTVCGPLPGSSVEAEIGFAPDGTTAIIELAQASGLTLLPESSRNPLKTTSYGVGQLIRHAVCNRKCRKIIIGLGGSACSDSGAGLMAALGVKITDKDGKDVAGTPEEILCGAEIAATAIDAAYKDVECVIASDVDNPLYGPSGAAEVFARQKGASDRMVGELDRAARRIAAMTARHTGRDFSHTPGAGAAGGAGFALLSLLGGKIVSGAELLLDMMAFESVIKDADLVITGEGSSDRQTLMGKLPGAIMRKAADCRKKVALLSGQIHHRDQLMAAGFTYAEAITPPGMPLHLAMEKATAMRNLANAACRLLERQKPKNRK